MKPGIDFEEPIAMIIGPFVYGFFAYICFSFGWIADSLCYREKPRTALYKAGVIFSLILTSLPGLWAVIAWVTTLITGRKLD